MDILVRMNNITIEISGYLITIVVLALLVTGVTFTIYGILIYGYAKDKDNNDKW